MCRFNPIKIVCYEVPSSSEWNPIKKTFFPNMFVDVSEHYDKKLTALVVYQNEMRNPPHPRSYENVMNILKVNGASCGLRHAERFMIIREVIC
jgi:LmbE family N-acetylglucosaminyl deacetylase